MSERTADHLDPDIAELLRKAEPYPDAPRHVQMRVRGALMQRMAAAGTTSGDDHDVATPPSEPPIGLLALASKPIRTLAATFALGAAAGAGLHAGLSPAKERVVIVERPAEAPTRAVSSGDIATVGSAPIAPPAALTAEPSATASRRAPAERDAAPSISNLGPEQALLDVARSALARGRADEALTPLDQHARRYPKGVLVEEREALAVNTLVTLGRYDEARERSARFLRRYPKSLLRPSVEAAVDAIP
jgi:hypothetical protein